MVLEAFPTLTLEQISESMRDLERYIEAITKHKSEGRSAPGTGSAGNDVLLCSIRETIAVLVKTKGSFKSKELGDLRRRLEALLAQGAEVSRKTD